MSGGRGFGSPGGGGGGAGHGGTEVNVGGEENGGVAEGIQGGRVRGGGSGLLTSTAGGGWHAGLKGNIGGDWGGTGGLAGGGSMQTLHVGDAEHSMPSTRHRRYLKPPPTASRRMYAFSHALRLPAKTLQNAGGSSWRTLIPTCRNAQLIDGSDGGGNGGFAGGGKGGEGEVGGAGFGWHGAGA